MQDDVNRTVGRLNRLRIQADNATGEAKGMLEEAYAREMKRSKEDFDYQMREVITSAEIDVQTLINQYGFGSEELYTQLEKIDLDVEAKKQQVLGQYINNVRGINASISEQIDLEQERRGMEMMEQQVVLQDFVEGGLNRSYTDVLTMVEEGNITQSQASDVLNSMTDRTI